MISDGYSKEESLFISGMSIIMMYFYHLFAFPDLWPDERCFYSLYYYKGIPVEQLIAPFGQLCVGIFAFNTGYILYKNSFEYLCYTSIFKRLFNFLIGYWIVCILFIIYGIVNSIQLPGIRIFISNLFGLNTSARVDYINVAHGWYVSYYLFLLLVLPLIVYISTRGKYRYLDFLLYIIWVLIVPYVPIAIIKYTWPITSTITGLLVCKYGLFEKCKGYLKLLRVWNTIGLSVGILFLTVFLRHFFSGYNAWGRLDGIYSFLTILSYLLIYPLLCRTIKKCFYLLGAMGLFLWFMHSIFVFDSDLAAILYAPRYPILITLWGIILMIIPTIIVAKIHKSVMNFSYINKTKK